MPMERGLERRSVLGREDRGCQHGGEEAVPGVQHPARERVQVTGGEEEESRWPLNKI